MEFLMTYGWSILIIGIIITVLFQLGAFNIGVAVGSGSCVSVSGYFCAKGSMNTAGAVSFTFGRVGVTGGAVNITAIGCSNTTAAPTIGWSSTAVNVTTLYSGQSETVIAPCSLSSGGQLGTSFKGTVWVQYITGNGGGGVQEQEVGTVNYAVSSAANPSSAAIITGQSKGMYGIAYNPSNGYMYVTNLNGGTVNVISGATVVATIPVGSNPYGIAYNPTNGYMYVSSVNVLRHGKRNFRDDVSSNNYRRLANPQGIAYNPSNGYMYVMNLRDSTVSVISGTTVVATIPAVGNGPMQAAYNPSNGYMYVVSIGSATGTVNVISGTTSVATITGLSSPQGIAYNPTNGDMYVADTGSNTVSVISGTTVVASITMQSSPTGIAYNPSNGNMYVTGDTTVSVISGTTIVATILGQSTPIGIAYNPTNGDMYVTNLGTGVVSILSGTTAVITVSTTSVGGGLHYSTRAKHGEKI